MLGPSFPWRWDPQLVGLIASEALPDTVRLLGPHRPWAVSSTKTVMLGPQDTSAKCRLGPQPQRPMDDYDFLQLPHA